MTRLRAPKRSRESEEEWKKNKKKGLFDRGFTAPGHNYMGPGNPMQNGPTKNNNDYVSRKHDEEYGLLELVTGKNPLTHWSDADETWLKDASWGGFGKAGKAYFNAKKLAYKAGLIDKIDIPASKKRLATSRNPDATKWRRLILDSTSKEAIKNTREDRQVRSIGSVAALPLIMSANGGSGNEAGLTETPIDQVPRDVHRGPPDYCFASLPYYEEQTFSSNIWAVDFTWRPTSVYDCKVDQASGGTDLNAGTGQSTHLKAADTDTTIDKARWFDFYASIYKYYHVVSCKYKIYVENLTNDDIFCHLMMYNDVAPPVEATNRDMMCWADTETRVLSARTLNMLSTGVAEISSVNSNVTMDETSTTAGQGYTYENGASVLNTVGKPATLFVGEYRTGDYDRQIRLDAQVENWTLVTTNPGLSERILLRIKHHWDSWGANDAINRDRNLKFTVRAELDYLVEFKELKDGLKYPINDQPYTATIVNTN